ncbi:MFS transporter [Sphingomonas sp. AAP5]|uniref:MFS transporter n=1 Tax=Sphingomonas sp. AAP5 TaxID=1523415 RepID=UPI0010573D13|nr:MFS transporter [Sphingomonas sp. AAP5]QBM75148.1 MFS transporter [Sphingomonas sp. AAP5]
MTSAQSRATGANPLDHYPIRRGQLWVLAIAMLLSALDGFDVLSMAFIAPALGRDWHIGKDAIGLLLASGLAGMAIGAFGLSPLGDVYGRKPVILGALVLMTFGTAVSAAAGSVPVLAAARVLTGVGIGAMIAMMTLISAEFSNKRRRPLAVAAIATLGTPIGSIIGGLGASQILKNASWHWVFLAGTICGVLLFILVALALPESPAFLASGRRSNSLNRLNRVMARLGHPGEPSLPPAIARARGLYRPLFAREMRGVLLRLMATGTLVASASYYVLSWLPQMVVDAGFTPAQGSLVSALSGVLSLIGGVTFAAFASRFALTKLSAIAMTGAAVALVAVGLVPPSLPFFIVSAGALGLCLAGTAGTLFAITADAFPPAMRAAGVGLVMGGLRIGSAAGPAIAGLMFAHGMTRAGVSISFALAPLIAAALIATFRHRSTYANKI